MKMPNKSLEYYMELPYRIEIIPDKEEGGYTAFFPDLPGCITCADSIEKLITEAEDAKREWIISALEEGIIISDPSDNSDVENYSGQFKLRMPKSLHRSLSVHAKKEGISMNQYCNYLLAVNDTAYQDGRLQSIG